MRETTNILGVNVDTIDMNSTLEKIKSFIKGDKVYTVYTPNPEFIMCAQSDEEFKEILNNSDLVLADGIGIILAARILNGVKLERVTGFDTTSNLLKMGSDGSISFYILGCKEGVADRAKQNLKKMYPNINIVGTHHGYFSKNKDEEEQIIKEINTLKPDILFVGMGSPRQEKWIESHKKDLNIHVAICNGGSFDIIAGDLVRAPKLFQKLGVEWLFRFILEPSRYKRIFKLFKFGFKVIFTKFFGKNIA